MVPTIPECRQVVNQCPAAGTEINITQVYYKPDRVGPPAVQSYRCKVCENYGITLFVRIPSPFEHMSQDKRKWTIQERHIKRLNNWVGKLKAEDPKVLSMSGAEFSFE